MNKFSFACLLLISILCLQCKTVQPDFIFQSEQLKIKRLSKNSFQHISYLPYSGKLVACNGLVFIHKKEAIVFDTPTDNIGSKLLIDWIEKERKANIKAIVVNHFHDDCLGGLELFHQKKIPSYANQATIELAKKDSLEVPINGFTEAMELTIGNKKIISTYFGPGHAMDNIASWIPSEKILFGGCMIKSLKASKGYLGNADVAEWPKTVAKIKAAYPDLKIAIPGHGKHGGMELLDYTIDLFEGEE